METTMFLIVICGTMVLVIAVAVSAFLREKHAAQRYFNELSSRGFRLVDNKKEVFKCKGFETIMLRDFLSPAVDLLEIKKSVLKYVVQETIVFGNCFIKEKREGSKHYQATFLLHLNPVCPTVFHEHLKFILKGKPDCSEVFGLSLVSVIDGPDTDLLFKSFVVSSLNRLGPDAVPEKIKKPLLDCRDKFPLRGSKHNGILVINPRGWLIVSVSCLNRSMFLSLEGLDKAISAAIS